MRVGNRALAEGQPSGGVAGFEDPAASPPGEGADAGPQTFYSLDRRGWDDARTYVEALDEVAEKYGNRPPGWDMGKH